jgi:hypothetical protein
MRLQEHSPQINLSQVNGSSQKACRRQEGGAIAQGADFLTQTEFNDAHLLLAIAYLRLSADAHVEAGKMLKINPTITAQAWRLGYSFRDSAMLDRHALDLVQSGLPET